MGLMDLVNVLQSYAGASATAPPASTQRDFERVSQSVPQQHLAGGLAEAFRSDQTPPFPQMLGNLFSQSNGQQRAGILNQLLGSVGGGVSGGLPGQLAGLLGNSKQITPEQAQQVPQSEVQELAQHAQRSDPSVVEQASNFYAQHPQVVQALGAGALALIMSHVSKRV
jgi:hypothetical protein